MTFASGAIGTIITTFATWPSQLPRIEIYGTEGTLAVPDPNTLAGPVRLCKAGTREWQDIELTHPHSQRKDMWGLGVVDMAYAILSGRPHRATGKQAYHVLDLMQSFLDSSAEARLEHREHHGAPGARADRPGRLRAGQVIPAATVSLAPSEG